MSESRICDPDPASNNPSYCLKLSSVLSRSCRCQSLISGSSQEERKLWKTQISISKSNNNEKVLLLLLQRHSQSISPIIYNSEIFMIIMMIGRLGHHRLQHPKQGGGLKNMMGRLSIAVVVLLICTVSLLLSFSSTSSKADSRSAAYRSQV